MRQTRAAASEATSDAARVEEATSEAEEESVFVASTETGPVAEAISTDETEEVSPQQASLEGAVEEAVSSSEAPLADESEAERPSGSGRKPSLSQKPKRSPRLPSRRRSRTEQEENSAEDNRPKAHRLVESLRFSSKPATREPLASMNQKAASFSKGSGFSVVIRNEDACRSSPSAKPIAKPAHGVHHGRFGASKRQSHIAMPPLPVKIGSPA